MLSAFVALAIGQGNLESVDMPLTTEPRLPIRALIRRPKISISQVKMAAKNEFAVLFRYSFPMELETWLSTLKAELTTAQGWTFEKDPGGGQLYIFHRKPTDKVVIRQLVTVQPYRFVRDESSPSKTRVTTNQKGWVCINYDEVRRR